ncbi:hypothetical protein [Streptomyces sp. NPDC047028]|uniref:hypothetical protein n=1 Tax=Streptomyces sp. NPDC047028 TaxID=3155793 RepID=UPI0033FA7AD1
MGAQPQPSGDELRIRHYLRAGRIRPFGHQEPTVSLPEPQPRPVTPTRIIPAGAPQPARAPAPGELPPWRTPPPPAPPPVAPAPVLRDPGPMVVRHVHEILLTSPDPEPEPGPRWWQQAWDRLVTWRMLAAILAALTPWAGGRSPVGIWAHTLHQARTEAGVLAAYVMAGVAITAAWAIDHHSSPPGQPSRALPRFLLVTALLGALGVLSWADPILALTGVHPS